MRFPQRVLAALVGPIAVGALTAGSAAGAEYRITREDVAPLGVAMRREIAGLHYLLNPHQLRQFFRLESDDDRRAWIDRVWKSQDPTPATDENEMRIEHEIRVNLARHLFANKNWPGWDRRGEVFIRYGPPNVRAKIPAQVTARRTHAPGEMWYYARHGMVVVFRDETLTGNYVYAVNALGASQDMSPELMEYLVYDAADTRLDTVLPPEYLDFYRDPEYDPDAYVWRSRVEEALVGPMQKKIIRPRMRGVTESMDDVVDPEYTRNQPDNPSLQFFTKKAEELSARFQETLDETPAAYPFNFEEDRYPFYFGIQQFKGGEGVNRVEVNLEFPVEPAGENEVGDRRIHTVTAVFWNTDHEEVGRRQREISIPVRAGAGEKVRLMPAQLVFSLPEGYYRMAVTVAERRRERADDGSAEAPYRERESSYRSTVSPRRFGGELAISDILFASRIAPSGRQSPFVRGALEVTPHPVRRYARGAPVPVYFELYNLGLDEEGLSSYQIEYRIVPHSSRKRGFWDRYENEPTVVSSRFDGSGYGADEPLNITIQSGNLGPGAYDLLVTVTDERWQSVAYRQATFRILE